MPVRFVSQQGRTYYRPDLSAEDVSLALGGLVEVSGYLVDVHPKTDREFHVSTRHIVEWWDSGWDKE